MKKLFFVLTVILSIHIQAQKNHYNTKKGVIAKGYDVTEYFNNKTIKGDKNFSSAYQGATFLFANEENLKKFNQNPEKYVPQYGGYCAYAIGVNGEKVDIDPKTYEIRDDKLYLFYNAWGINTLEKWKKESPEQLKPKADAHWQQIINNE